jgi:membrane-associated phospholipid phosphatase
MTATVDVTGAETGTDTEVGASTHPYRSAFWVLVVGYTSMTLALLVVGIVLTHVLDGTVGRWDEHLNETLARHRTNGWNDITQVATRTVETLPVVAGAAVVAVILAIARRWREAAMFVSALVLEITVFLSVTFLIARPRPDVPRLNSTPSTSSFPSGHAAAATVFTVGVALIVFSCTRNRVARTLAVIVAVGYPILVGFARVYRGMHHPTDVFVAWIFGISCLYVAVLAVRTTFPRRAVGAADESERQAEDHNVKRIA